MLKKWERETITDGIKRKSAIDVQVHDCYNFGKDEMIFLASSNFNKGECLRSMKFDDKELRPHVNFSGNSQVIRTTLFDEKKNIFYTFGENAVISIWKEVSLSAESAKEILKDESSVKKKLKKISQPY